MFDEVVDRVENFMERVDKKETFTDEPEYYPGSEKARKITRLVREEDENFVAVVISELTTPIGDFVRAEVHTYFGGGIDSDTINVYTEEDISHVLSSVQSSQIMVLI